VPKTMSPSDLETLDRLESKVRMLVAEIGKLRADQARQAEESRRLTRELEAANARLQDAAAATAEMAVLRDERDQVRSRVAGILEQLEGLDI
jgi:regulator of replication initiation timing